MQIHAKEILSLKEETAKSIPNCGKSVEEIASALERDKFLTAEEAKDFGLIDKVVEKEINTTTYSFGTTYTCLNIHQHLNWYY